MRFFNTAGPVREELHYWVPPLSRLDLDEVLMLIEQQKYFVLHAPRQTGKTSCLFALMGHLNEGGRYRALYANLENAQVARSDVDRGMRMIVQILGMQARDLVGDADADALARRVLAEKQPAVALEEFLSQWCREASKPTVLFLDEVDALVGDTLISLLRQLRSGYSKRPALFPQSLVLCGVRDVRDYRIHSESEKSVITGGSAFNVKAESLRLGDFTRSEVGELYGQHTEETGQLLGQHVVETVWDLTRGQPWLVNALGHEVTWRLKQNRDRSRPVTVEQVLQAKENLILRRETHLDQLADKLQEERVRSVIEPILADNGDPERIPTDDVSYVRDLGLIRTEARQLTIANPIYREVIPRELTYTTQLVIAHETEWYVREDGRLDVPKLLAAFQEFFREHSEHWIERFDYKEAGPQLLLQAFLQRVVNAGGRVEREYGLGRRRTDLLVIWPGKGEGGGAQKVVIELKLVRGSVEATLAEGLPQTADYMDRCGSDEGHLVVFDRAPGKSWEARIFRRNETCDGRPIVVWGM
jgi:hypothetical protein